jgi:hypothetical protein
MIMLTPELAGEALKAFTVAEEPLAAAIAERTGAAADDLFPRVMAATVAGVVRVAGRQWLDSDGSAPLAAVLRRALSHILPADR